ncbi:MAG: epoxide hydrolase [Microbacterium sp.]|uniref:epoxide hydrolase family protein n=1 Tax=Microbacterium sp. TaxID=51671 RepID=UPI002607278C|nr:epoxide hydrolase family protein [Microbacterium sp.]MCX6502073.1 epoxide hydrolase [Microbacterium sp.]
MTAAEIDDLRARLTAVRPVPLPPGHGWHRGVDAEYLADLLAFWARDYDWTRHEARIQALPWRLVGNARPLRVIYREAASRDAPVLLLLHGWPDSALRFERLLPLLDDVTLVIPALPGFPFAVPMPEGGLSSAAMAEMVADAMTDLGHDRYVVSAGDVGCDVAEALAAGHPHAVSALHLTDVSQYHFLVDPPEDLSPAERAYVRHGHEWQRQEGGYMYEQSTKPHTLAAALGESPAGLAAWILEKLRGWIDGDLESVFSREELLTWISAYWFGRCIGTSFTPYAEGGAKPWGRVAAPTAFTVFPKDLVNAPREFADRYFAVESWEEPARGGHFAAFEQPDAYARGVRTALSLAR